MAVDNKAKHVGNHGGVYTDNDGMSKQFTYIDHDKKSKVSYNVSDTSTSIALNNYIKEKIEITLLLPAVNIAGASNGIYDELLKRTDTSIIWNEEAVTEHIKNNINTFLTTLLWRRTVSQMNWHHPMWIEGNIEALRRGDWKSLTP